jgi:hypothetical protein
MAESGGKQVSRPAKHRLVKVYFSASIKLLFSFEAKRNVAVLPRYG